jgi:DNA-binding NtrC family response regulator/anti-sigma regulatory factor (Ser/Thr protein kinase)
MPIPASDTRTGQAPPSREPAVPVSVLIVDDEELLVKSCGQILSSEGYTVLTEGRVRPALEAVRRHRPDIVLTDLMLPDGDGLALLKDIKKLAPETLVVMITGFATVDSSVEAIRAGAYDYVPKPFTATQLRILMGRAAQQVQLVRDNAHLRDELKKHYSFENIIGTSDAIQKVFSVVARVAPTDASVLVSGETGTGKELIARAIHANSRRSERPFMAINCAALPDRLLESELFGHVKGAFTSADKDRRGLLEVASGGTFFLDEISEMSMDLQAKLLHVIQERRIRRMGGEDEIPIDVRWVSATNRDPEQAVRDGSLRQELLYRLNVVPVSLPPLRMRREDIPALVQHYLRRYTQEYERERVSFSADALRVLAAYAWPGNVRELQNTVEQIVSLSLPGQKITPDDLPVALFSQVVREEISVVIPADLPLHDAKAKAVAVFEKEYLRFLLARHGGNVALAARTAGANRRTIQRMLARHALTKEDYGAGRTARPGDEAGFRGARVIGGEAPGQTGASYEALLQVNETLTAENKRLKGEQERLRALPENAGWSMTFSFFGTLVRSVAHDLRNTFEKVVMSVELLREDPAMPPHLERTLSVLLASALRGEQLFRDMLRELEELSPATEELDLVGLIEEIRDEMAAQLSPAIELDVARPARPGRVRCNPHFVKVVLLELVRNAAKALGTSPGHVRVRLRAGRDVVSVVVDDDGPGIPPVVLDYLRNPQGHRPPGIGTGLSLSSQLVSTFGGELRVERSSPRGSSVAVTLPRAPRRPSANAASESDDA